MIKNKYTDNYILWVGYCNTLDKPLAALSTCHLELITLNSILVKSYLKNVLNLVK